MMGVNDVQIANSSQKKNNLIVFGDFQKILSVIIIAVYAFICVYYAFNLIKFRAM